MSRPNIIVIMPDQQRWDTLGCLGFPYMQTPHLDALARRGVCFRNACVQGAICTPSRASIVSGKYVHTHGAMENGTWLAEGEPNWIEQFQRNGYHTANIGKMHTHPVHLPCGFDYRFVVENKNHDASWMGDADDYDALLAAHGLTRPALSYMHTVEDWFGQLGATTWPLDEKLYPDNVVGERSVEYLQQHDFSAPLLLWVGFPGPHDPYDVPESALARYEGVEIPDPVGYPGEIDDKPDEQQAGMREMEGYEAPAAIWWSRYTPEAIRRVRRHYYANVSLIDDWIGKLVAAVEQAGQLENTIFVFTSDHGDALGDHHHIYKFWSHYDSVVRVPFIVAGPGVAEQPVRDKLVELIDLGPTLLDMAGVPPIDDVHGVTLRPLLEGENVDIHDAVFSEYQGRVMIRTQEWKLVFYAGQPSGELYHLTEDPDELHNLFDNTDLSAIRGQLEQRLLNWYIQTRYEIGRKIQPVTASV